MIDSLISRVMPHGDNTHDLTKVRGRKRRPSSSGQRPDNGKDVRPCKKRKKAHKWRKKTRPRDTLTKAKCKAKKGLRAKPEAPFNSTQFIMDEHDNLNDSDLSTGRPRRHRDSSLSMESEDYIEDDVYSSPEDEEEEFMARQFWCAYEDYHAERLDAMSKSQLVQEYFALEERLTLLERQLKTAQEQDQRRIREPSPVEDDDEEEVVPGEVPVDPETAAKIEIFRSEIQKLEEENERLRKENSHLRRGRPCRSCSPSDNSLSDSTSLSSDSSSSSSSTSDSEVVDENLPTAGNLTTQGPSTTTCLVGGDKRDIATDEEFELSSESTLKRGDKETSYFGPDSGIASSAASSSGEDVRTEEDAKRRHQASHHSDNINHPPSPPPTVPVEVNQPS